MAWEIELNDGSSGAKPVREFLDSLQGFTRAKVYAAMELLKGYGVGLGFPHVKKLAGTQLWELRTAGESKVRVIYVARYGKKFLLLHGFVKKEQKTPRREIAVAEERLREHSSRLTV